MSNFNEKVMDDKYKILQKKYENELKFRYQYLPKSLLDSFIKQQNARIEEMKKKEAFIERLQDLNRNFSLGRDQIEHVPKIKYRHINSFGALFILIMSLMYYYCCCCCRRGCRKLKKNKDSTIKNEETSEDIEK